MITFLNKILYSLLLQNKYFIFILFFIMFVSKIFVYPKFNPYLKNILV